MAVKEEYDVLRLIEHNQVCYISSEYIRGAPLPRWIKYHPGMKKEELFRMISDIAKQLWQIHRCRGNPCYRYVNPYSIIVSEDGRAGFLDVNAESNGEQLRLMQRRTVREHFLPPEEPYYQKASIELDIYGLGKTLQYILSEVETDPPLSRAEEAKFQKIISRCLDGHSKKSYQNVSEIQKMIPKYKQPENKTAEKKKLKSALIIVIGLIGFAGIVAGGGMIVTDSIYSASDRSGRKLQQEKDKQDERAQADMQGAGVKTDREDDKSGGGKSGQNEERLNMELGTVYFSELKNYEKSKEYFSNAKNNKLAEYMAVIAECFAGNSVQSERLRQALSGAEDEVKSQDEEAIGEKRSYYRCMLKGYTVLDKGDDFRNILRLGEMCLQDGTEEEMSEISGYLAFAYEGLGDTEHAVSMYEEQLKYEKNEAVREEIYKKDAYLLMQSGNNGRAQEILRTGIKDIEGSAELCTAYIAALLGDGNVERQLCLQTISEQLKALPELKEQEEFKKLMKQYGITVEGDKVW